MRIVSTLALGLALAGAGVAAPALAKKTADAPAPAKYSPAAQKALAAMQDALKKNDVAGATAALAQAKAAASNDDDRYATGTLEYQLYQQTKDQGQLSDAVDMMIASNKAPQSQLAQLYTVQTQIAYQGKNYGKAATSAQAAVKAGATDPALVPLMVQSMADSGQPAQAMQALNAAIDANVQAGKPVPAEWFQRGVSLGYTTKGGDLSQMHDQTTLLTQKWLAAYPTKSNWHDALTVYAQQYKIPTDQTVDMFRLLRAAGALNSDADYREYADDVYLRNPGEAKAVLDEGKSKGVVNASSKDVTEVLGIVNGKVAADKASLPKSEAAARSAATGTTALSLGDGYASYGQYPQAIDMYKVAVGKGGATADAAQLHLGWALAMSGDAAGAKQAFSAVNGARKPLAQFWLVHLDHPTAG